MRSSLIHPARMVALAFALAIGLGMVLLMLPWARATGTSAPWLVALFTSVSAVCVTGLAVVDTGTYWSSFGQWVIVGLFQMGGFGMMTAATLLGLMVNNTLRLRTRLIQQAEAQSLGLGDVRSVAKLVLIVTLLVEAVVAVLLMLRLHLGYGAAWGDAAWSGLFHSISAFNNAGFSIYSDNLVRFAGDAWVLLPLMASIVIGGIGFPVLRDLLSHWRGPRHLALHTKITLTGTAVLLVAGFALLLWFEWANPDTLGPMGWGDKALSAAFASVSARTAGFNTVDIGKLAQESISLHYLLMFIGAGSASTAGGVKVSTFFVLILLVWSVVRGRRDTEGFGRRISIRAQREAATVLLLGSALVALGTLVVLHGTQYSINQVIFEVVSAFGTAGLSTGITADLPAAGQLTLIALMYAGRVGTITLATSLALGEQRMSIRYPEEHPLVG